MALKIVEGFQAIEAFVLGLAGGAAKLAHHLGVLGVAMGAGFGRPTQQGVLIGRGLFRGGYAVLAQLFFGFIGYPVGGPRGA